MSRAADRDAVMEAASALGLREVDFFRLAQFRWTGAEPDPAAIDRAFGRYMMHGTVPAQVRHLAREVVAKKAAGTLNPAAYGVSRYRRILRPHPHGKAIVAGTLLLVVFLLALLLDTTYHPGTSAPMPCRGLTGFKMWEDWVYMISGKKQPACDGAIPAGAPPSSPRE